MSSVTLISEKHQPAAGWARWAEKGDSSFHKGGLFGRRASPHNLVLTRQHVAPKAAGHGTGGFHSEFICWTISPSRPVLVS